MKKTIFLLTFSFLSAGLFAQSDKYVKAMEALVPSVDTTHSIDTLLDLSNSFQRIAEAEKTQWLPYYYTALCTINAVNMYFVQKQMDKIDPLLDKIEPMISKAGELEKDNSEIYCLKKMFNTCKMMVDPMSRYMQYGAAASEALETAKKLNPENPRVYLLEGEDKFYTPEQYGGSKDDAKKLFDTAQEKFGIFKPASDIMPAWGVSILKYFQLQYK